MPKNLLNFTFGFRPQENLLEMCKILSETCSFLGHSPEPWILILAVYPSNISQHNRGNMGKSYMKSLGLFEIGFQRYNSLFFFLFLTINF